ncbi:MAG: zinc ABC transporter substrate-binding protein [bacterium]|nr:zinc ABC transporter substrate-binding protein [bacterium]
MQHINSDKNKTKTILSKNIFFNYLVFFILIYISLSSFIYAKVNIVVSYGYIESIVKEIGKDKVDVFSISSSRYQDPHYVVPKPSYVVKLSKADLLIINGASLEIGFIPVLIKQANNPKINPGNIGYLELSNYFDLIDKPKLLSRDLGDIHPEGNPHFYLDPYNIIPIANIIYLKLSEIDKTNQSFYEKNFENFKQNFSTKLSEWDKKMENFKGVKVFQYHSLYDYFLRRYGIELVANLEPKPGIPPTPKYIENLLEIAKNEKVFFILQDYYHKDNYSKYISSKTNLKILYLPHDDQNIYKLFDEIVNAFYNSKN